MRRGACRPRPRVSQAVRVGGFSATCDQCDLDSHGRPLHAGELWPQVEAVTRHLRRRLEHAGAPLASVRRLEAFYVGLANERALRAALVEAVGGEPDVLLVPIYRCADSGPIVAGIPLPQLPCRVRVSAIAAEVPPPDIIFVGARLPVDECGQVQHPSDVEAQTRLVMSRIGHQLRGQDASLADLVKVTVHYVGGPRPEDLHRNLDVRSQLYVPPGPASTGVPVPELQLPGETILIEAIAIRG